MGLLAPLAAALALLASPAPVQVVPVGEGIALVEVRGGVRIELSEAPGAAPAYVFEVEGDTVLQSYRLDPEPPAWFDPETLWLDYTLFTFRVLEVKGEALKVVVDDAGRTLWLQRSGGIVYKPWAQFLIEDVTNFDRVNPRANPLRTAPDDGAPVIPHEGRDGLMVTEVRGDWARVRRSDLWDYEGSEVQRVEEAWVRWRDAESLLVEYGMTC